MTSLPAAPVRVPPVEAPQPGDLSGRTVAVRVPAESDAIPQMGARFGPPAGPQAAAGRRVMTEVHRVQVPAGVNAGVSAGRIVVRIVLLVAGRTVRASGVAPC